MSRIIKLRQGDKIPEGAKFIYAQQEEVNVRYKRQIKPCLAEYLTLGLYYETQVVKKCGYETYFYYQVDK